MLASPCANVIFVGYDVPSMLNAIDFRPVILAGGSGTRFWPRSRRARAKQVLALDGERSMIQQTVERLKPLAALEKTWIITNEFLAHEIADQLPGLPAERKSCRSLWPATPLPPAAWPLSSSSAKIPTPFSASFLPTTSSPTSRVSSRLCKRASPWPQPATTSWCWASSLRAPRPATATSKPAT